MKKLTKVLALVAMTSALFIGCKDPSSEPVDPAPETPGTETTVTPIEQNMDSSSWGWGYSSKCEYDGTNLTITLTDEYGAGSFGYNDAKDLTGYKTLEVEFVSVTGADPWHQVIIQSSDGEKKAEKDSKETGAHTVSVDLTSGTLDIKDVKQVSIQGKAAGDVIVVKSVTIK